MDNLIDEFAQTIRAASNRGAALSLGGSGSKAFYGVPCEAAVLDVTGYRGVVQYEPTELVITVRAGTRLADVETTLAERDQMFAFEPPRFGPGATVGGCVATGLSGPRRAYAGAVRDFVLGIRMIDGRGADLSFGGQVMKNVAGFDVSRLAVGSLGTLGLLLEVSFKVLPRPPEELTLRFEMDEPQAIAAMNRWAGSPLPLSATCHRDGCLTLRLSGAAVALASARAKLGGERVDDGPAFWTAVREQTLDFFAGSKPLWRLSVKSTTPPLDLIGDQLIEWGGALRWLASDLPADVVRAAAANAGGHATLFRARGGAGPVFHPLPAPLLALHQRLKRAFDPHGVLNPGRMFADL
jgi:glycolate dehydrogenase FAD-binding subunit